MGNPCVNRPRAKQPNLFPRFGARAPNADRPHTAQGPAEVHHHHDTSGALKMFVGTKKHFPIELPVPRFPLAVRLLAPNGGAPLPIGSSFVGTKDERFGDCFRSSHLAPLCSGSPVAVPRLINGNLERFND